MKRWFVVPLCLTVGLLLAACGDTTPADTAAATPTAVVAVDTPTAPSETMTETQVTTTTEVITSVEEMTDTSAITGVEGVTTTTEMTGAETMTGTGGVTATPEITATDELTERVGVTGSAGAITGTGVATGADLTDVEIPSVTRASDLLGYDVENSAGEDLGSVEDMMVNLDNTCIDYMVLSFGGILGLGANEYLIPWQAVQIDPYNGRLLLNIDQEVLNDAPIIDRANMPDLTAEDWAAPYTTFWDAVTINPPATLTDTTGVSRNITTELCEAATAGSSTGATGAVTDTTAAETTGIQLETPQVIQLSDLLEYDLHNTAGEDLGELEDIMVDWRRDRLAYAILSFGGILGLGEKWFALPLDQLRLDALEQRLIVDADPERLENAPGFDPDQLPDTNNPNWDEEIRQYWNTLQ